MYPWSVGALCPVQSLQIPASMRARIRTASPSAGGHGHETVVKPNRALSRRYPVNHLAVRPVSIANRDRLQRPASRHHGRSAEARGKAGSIARGDTHRGTPPGIESSSSAVVVRSGVIVIRSHAVGCARSGHAEDCQAGGTRQQLQRWLRNELQIRQGPLGRMQRVRRAGMRLRSSRSRAEIRSPTKATRIAWRPNGSWAGTSAEPGGIVAASTPAQGSRSQTSNDQELRASA